MKCRQKVTFINVDWLGFFKLIVESLLSLPPLPCGILTLMVVLREHIITIGEFVVSITPIRAVCDGEGKF